jgi:hypothetical protein
VLGNKGPLSFLFLYTPSQTLSLFSFLMLYNTCTHNYSRILSSPSILYAKMLSHTSRILRACTYRAMIRHVIIVTTDEDYTKRSRKYTPVYYKACEKRKERVFVSACKERERERDPSFPSTSRVPIHTYIYIWRLMGQATMPRSRYTLRLGLPLRPLFIKSPCTTLRLCFSCWDKGDYA